MQMACQITSVKTIADRLKEARTARDWSQEDLAAASKVSQGTIGNVESGARKRPRELLKIAAALGVRPEWLQDGEGPKYSPITGTSHITFGDISQVSTGTVHPPPALDQALPVVLDALARLTPGRWGMVMSGLAPLAGHPEMLDDVMTDIAPLFATPAVGTANRTGT